MLRTPYRAKYWTRFSSVGWFWSPSFISARLPGTGAAAMNSLFSVIAAAPVEAMNLLRSIRDTPQAELILSSSYNWKYIFNRGKTQELNPDQRKSRTLWLVPQNNCVDNCKDSLPFPSRPLRKAIKLTSGLSGSSCITCLTSSPRHYLFAVEQANSS